MARKKTEQPNMPATQAETEMRAVRLYLPSEIHDEFRVMAARQRTNMALLARKIIEEYVKGQKKGGGK
jgi:hypothetical protein